MDHCNKHTFLLKFLNKWEAERSEKLEYDCWDFPGGELVKNLPANAGDTDSIPGPGRSHMPWRN